MLHIDKAYAFLRGEGCIALCISSEVMNVIFELEKLVLELSLIVYEFKIKSVALQLRRAKSD